MSRMLTLVLLGGTAVGKSSTGNTILGRRAFESRFSRKPVTTRVSEYMEEIQEQQVSVVDTPGILNPKALELLRPVFDEYLGRLDSTVFLVVLKVDHVFSEQIKALERTVELLGDEGMEHSLMLFTHGARLQGQDLEEFISEDDESSLLAIFNRFGMRHHVFDNESGEPEQVQMLLQKIQRLGRREIPPGVTLEDVDLHRELRLVLLGFPGAGKSESGNTILHSKKFITSCGFNPMRTEEDPQRNTVLGRRVTVVDTPGFSDEKLRPKELFTCILKSVIKLKSGPHAFIIVVRLGRVNGRDTKLLQLMPKLFDEVASKFTMVLFTHGDDLGEETIEDLIKENVTMKTLIDKCGQRYFVFDNKRRDLRQVRELFDKIDTMVQASGEDHCNSQIFKLTTAEKTNTFHILWQRLKNAFTCCLKPNVDSDEEEMQPLFNKTD